MSKTLPIKLWGNKLYQTNKQTKTVGFELMTIDSIIRKEKKWNKTKRKEGNHFSENSLNIKYTGSV